MSTAAQPSERLRTAKRRGAAFCSGIAVFRSVGPGAVAAFQNSVAPSVTFCRPQGSLLALLRPGLLVGKVEVGGVIVETGYPSECSNHKM